MSVRAGLVAALVVVAPVSAQQGTPDSAVALPPITVAVTRAPVALDRAPYAVGRLDAPLATADLGLSLAAALAGVPGITVQARGNAARDDGLAIRGFGARAAFGVRGIRILLDGIPQTLPDGQSQLTLVNARRLASVEVLRGAASALYGNATGGVVSLRTDQRVPDGWNGGARAAAGSYGLVTADLDGRIAVGRGFVDGAVQRDGADGYRAQSRYEVWRAHVATRQPTAAGSLGWVFDLADYPEAQDPGALTAAELAADPRQANPGYVAVDAGKAVWQGQSGLTLERALGTHGNLETAVFGARRELDNRLPFASIRLDRWAYGGRAVTTIPLDAARRVTVVTGADAQWLRDDRVNRTPDGATVTRDQLETVRELGPFVQLRVTPMAPVTVLAGARYDWVRFGVADRQLADGDASGERTMRAPSGTLGVSVVPIPGVTTWVRVGTAFETPTTTELANTPAGDDGFNPELQPQHATELEVGVRLAAGAVSASVAGFRASVRDELVPFEVPSDPGRRYFRNAGRSRHQGVELEGRARWGDWTLAAAYTLSDLRFTDFATADQRYDGNRIPGVPVHLGRLAATVSAGPVRVESEARASSKVFADDANTAVAEAWWVVDLRLLADLPRQRWGLHPTVGIENLFGRRYVGAVAVNGAGGRYYEPAPGRTFYVGLTLDRR